MLIELKDSVKKNRKKFKYSVVVSSVAVVLQCLAWFYALCIVGQDVEQGHVYRLIFVHVPVAWCAFLWIGVSALCAIGVFVCKNPVWRSWWDVRSVAAAQWGVILGLCVLVTGSFWGRPTWGVWWDWDPRLTSSLVMFLVGCAYLSMRYMTLDVRSRQNLCAIVSILNAVHVPIVYLSVNLWRSLHQPQTFVYAQHNASSDIAMCLFVNVIAMTILTISIWNVRVCKEELDQILNFLRTKEAE